MCGITGIVGSTPQDPNLIAEMTKALRHRGPDDSGIWTSENAHLGHTRLSILDPSEAGHQPMEFGDLVLTYNGEIYNYRELRGHLDGPFRSDTDTEVLLHLFRRYGDACVHQLRGMFSFAIWDRKHRRLFAARDRLGIKPFIYTTSESGLAFASEIKSLLKMGIPALDRHSIDDYLTYRYIPTPRSIYSGILKLPPAHTLVWQDGRTTIDRYWYPEIGPRIVDAGVAVEALDDLLQKVIPDHAIADVPVGVFLSGGVDSATAASYLNRPTTVTLGNDVDSRNEAPAAKRLASHFGSEHFEEMAGAPDLEAAVSVMPQLFDEPLADSGAWATYLVSQAARRHVTVAMTGEGGDELFLGYKRHGMVLPDRAAPLYAFLAGIVPALTDTGRSVQRRSLEGFERYAELSSSFTKRQKHALLSRTLSEPDRDDHWYFRQHWREDLSPLEQARWLDIHTYLPDALLTKVDRAGMAHSLEIRPPFLDHRLVEFALSLHPDLLRSGKGKTGKILLRSLMRDRLPSGHLDQPKIGFNLPIRRWIRSNPGILRRAMDRLHQSGIVRKPRLMHVGGEQIWSLLVLDRFLHGEISSGGR